MYDLTKIENDVSPIIEKLKGLDEHSARSFLMEEISYISKLTAANWEREKLEIIKLKIEGLSEAKLDKIKKLAHQSSVVVDTDMEIAKQKIRSAYCVQNAKSFSYVVLDGKDLRPFPPQEMTPLIKLVADDDKMEESRLYEAIHSKRQIDKISTHISPGGITHYVISLLENKKYEAVCVVSIEEMLKNQLRRVERYEILDAFKNMVQENFKYVFDIYEYAMAIKFVFDKTNCIWLREHSDTGKTFFLGAREAEDYILIANEKIEVNDFVGDGPDKWGKMLFWFIDEATKFGSEMKNACLPYRMNYGGRVNLNIPLRILSSDNEITDLTNGVDKQIDNRVINMHYLAGKFNLRKWLDANKLDATTAQMMWQKMILSHLLDLIHKWGESENLPEEAAKTISKFKLTYKKEKMLGIGESIKEIIASIVNECMDLEGNLNRQITKAQRDFRDFLILEDKKVYLKSPKAFFMMALKEYAPEKEKSFFKKYPNNDSISILYGDEYKPRALNGTTIKCFLVASIT